PKSQFGIDPENNFAPKYITIRGKGDLIKELKDAAKKAKRIFLATDPDREGEAISWHLAQILNIDPSQKCRVEFHEITKRAIAEAFKKPRSVDMSHVDAQQARRVLDRIVGYQLSPLLWKKVRRGLSAGRVQSVAVRLICDRENEIESFVPREYWSLTAQLSTPNGEAFTAKLHSRRGEKQLEVSNKGQMDQILAEIDPQSMSVVEVKRSERRRQPAAPFTTSSLQQEASRRLGFTARKTMMIAQQLYEGLELGKEGSVGLVTYIRTDSTQVSSVAYEEAQVYIGDKYGSEYRLEQPRVYASKKGAQEAHEAIRPTAVERTPDSVKSFLTRDQHRLYKLIWDRFLASQMAAAVLDTVSAELENRGYIFRASGSTVKFAGFMVLYIESQDEEQKDEQGLLPPLSEGEEVVVRDLAPKQHFTQPPARFTEAMLVKTLEELGIGRPSTYAPTIDTVVKRGYVNREEKRFVPSELGMLVNQLLSEYFPDIVDPEFTAQMEEDLDQIEGGSKNWVDAIREFYGPFQHTVTEAEEKIGPLEIADEVSDTPCDLCGRMMVIKHGRYGPFLACPGFPDCKNTKPIVKSTGVACPKCGGQLLERKSKKGRKFYGCENYPNCDFVSWEQPVSRSCSECGSKAMSQKLNKRDNTITYRCLHEGCSFEETVPAEEEDDFE
ncbi:MAG: type I DNA topoisomerase, partial [Bacillota bacterium]